MAQPILWTRSVRLQWCVMLVAFLSEQCRWTNSRFILAKWVLHPRQPPKQKRHNHKGCTSFVGADDGIVTRGANCAPWSFAALTVHRTVIHYRSYFKSHHLTMQKHPDKKSGCLYMVRMTGFEPTRISSLEPETSASAVPPHLHIKLFFGNYRKYFDALPAQSAA